MRAKIITSILIALILIGAWTRTRTFVEFVPLKLVEGRRNELVPAPELVTPAYMDRVRAVLVFYGEKFRTNSEGKLLITRGLSNDRELIWNYSNQAQEQDLITQFQNHIKRRNPTR